MRRGESLWIPYGSYPLVNGDAPVNTFVSMPFLCDALKTTMSNELWDLMKASLTTFFRKVIANNPWAAMKDDIEAFYRLGI